jgi:hypothetical protein
MKSPTVLDDGVCAVDSSFELLVEACVSVDATTSNDQINLYPNPASDWLHMWMALMLMQWKFQF